MLAVRASAKIKLKIYFAFHVDLIYKILVSRNLLPNSSETNGPIFMKFCVISCIFFMTRVCQFFCIWQNNVCRFSQYFRNNHNIRAFFGFSPRGNELRIVSMKLLFIRWVHGREKLYKRPSNQSGIVGPSLIFMKILTNTILRKTES